MKGSEMKKRVMLTSLQLRILKISIEKGRMLTPTEITNQLNINIGSARNSLESLKKNRSAIRNFAKVLFKAEEEGVFEKPKSDWRQLRVEAIIKRVKEGYHYGRAPRGCYLKDNVIFFIDEWVPRIQLAWKLKLEGYTNPEIEEKTEIPKNVLPHMFSNPVYAGMNRYGRLTCPGKHYERRIIDEKDFEKVQPVKEGYTNKDRIYGFKVRRGKHTPREGEAENMEKAFLLRKKGKSVTEIKTELQLNQKTDTMIKRFANPKYAGKKWENGELVDDPYIEEAIVDFETVWKPVQAVSQKERALKETKKKGAETHSKVWNALAGTPSELKEKTELSKDQISHSIRFFKEHESRYPIVRLQDARWYPKDQLALLLHQKLKDKGWKTLLPKRSDGIKKRDKILNVLLEGQATLNEIHQKTGIHPLTVKGRLAVFITDGLVERTRDYKYYISEENVRFLRMTQDMLQAIRRQYS